MDSRDKAQSSDVLPQVALDYVTTVVRKMRYRRVRQDVKAELHAHFEDALTECRTDQQRQETAEQLIEAFGDTKLLAKLIRRAKKRCRPMWQKFVIRTSQVCGAFVLYSVLCVSRLYFGQPVIKVDTIEWLNEAMIQGRSEELNAHPGIEEAVRLLPERPKDLRNSKIEDMNDLERGVLKAYLDDCLPALDLLREAVRKPHYWCRYMPMDDASSEGRSTSVDRSSGRSSPFPSLELSAHLVNQAMPRMKRYRQLAFALRHQIQRDCEQRRGDRALSDGLVLTRFGRLLCGTALLVEEMVGVAIVELGVAETRRVLSKLDSNRQDLTAAYQSLEQVVNMDRPWFTYEYEKALYYDMIQQGFTDDGHGNGRPLAQGVLVAADTLLNWWKGLLLFDYPDRRETTQRIDTLYENMDRLANQLTPWDHKNESDRPPIPVGLLTGIVLPAYERIAQLSWRMRTSCQATLAILAIKRYEKIHGTLPDGLNDLVRVGLMDALPRDYFSDGTFGYRRSAEGFILYSRGEDLKDDGGTPATNEQNKPRRYGSFGDWIFWPISPN